MPVEMILTLYPAPTFSSPTPLSQAKAAFSFGIQSFVQHILPGGEVEQPSDVGFGRSQAIPALITRLVAGCRRKLVIYTWQDGEARDTMVVKENMAYSVGE
jgi:Vam6/Vps39-like protein vacuolar protein sorting-associated protein 39